MPTLDTVARAARMPKLYANFGSAYLNRFRPYAESEAEVRYRLRNGVRLTAAPGPHDVKIINEIWLDEDYAAPGFIPTSGWTIVDFGANKGFFATWALTMAPDARIHCFEPDPRNVAALRSNLQPFGGSADVHEVAVGSQAGSLTLFRLAGRAGQASVFRSRAQSRGSVVAEIAVPVVAVGDLLPPLGRIDLLKVDVEGAEYDILLDTPPAALAQVQRVVMEADEVDPAKPSRAVGNLLDHLRGLGFSVAGQRRTVHFLSR